MLTRIQIDNFKSLSDLTLPGAGAPLQQFVCLVGLNGAGKSSVLQAIDFLAQLAVGDVNNWLAARNWERVELLRKGSKKRIITFELEWHFSGIGRLRWAGSYNVQQERCTKEELDFFANEELFGALPHVDSHFSLENGVLKESDRFKRDLTSDYIGSVFNKLRVPSLSIDPRNAIAIYLLRFALQGVKSLELLSPQAMRKGSKKAVDVGSGGETLAAFVDGLPEPEKAALTTELVKFYPRLQKISSRAGKYGWKRLTVSEFYESVAELDARHVNDGLLRVAAIIAQTVANSSKKIGAASEKILDQPLKRNPDQKGYQYILLDEIENGMNPEIVERLVKYLLSVRQQVFVTTHSPLILNFLSDSKAMESVFIVYRTSDGSSKAKRFFEIPAVREKLDFMGPGEAFLDVKLEAITAALAGASLE